MAPSVAEAHFRAVALLRRYQPIAELELPLRKVAEQLYGVGSGIYLLVTDTDASLSPTTSGPLFHHLGWAPTDGSARRAFLGDLDADDGVTEPIPTWAALGWRELEHASIMKRVAQAGATPVTTASYDTSGRFVQRTITIDRTAFLFRSNRDEPKEAPYAVKIHPRA